MVIIPAKLSYYSTQFIPGDSPNIPRTLDRARTVRKSVDYSMGGTYNRDIMTIVKSIYNMLSEGTMKKCFHIVLPAADIRI